MSEAATIPNPAPTPERIMFQVQTAAIVRALGAKKGEAVLRAMADDFARRGSFLHVEPLRPSPLRPAKVAAEREAIAAFLSDLPMLLASIHRP